MTPVAMPTASAEEASSPPEKLVLAVRTAIQHGVSSRWTNMYDCDGKSYTHAAVLEVIKKQDAAAGGGSTGPRVKKGEHCVPPWVELQIDQWLKGRVAASMMQQQGRRGLDGKHTGKARRIPLELWDAFKSEEVKAAQSLAGIDPNIVAVAGIDPNVVHQPDLSLERLVNMAKVVMKDYGECDSNVKKPGSSAECLSCCGGTSINYDMHYLGEAPRKHPQILAVSNQMLPEDVQRKKAGVGTRGVNERSAKEAEAEADAMKRETAKRKAREDSVHLGGHNQKARKQEKVLRQAANMAFDTAKDESGLADGGQGGLFAWPAGHPLADAPSSWHDTKVGCETRTAKLELSDRLLTSLRKFKAALQTEKAQGDDADPDEIDFLEAQVTKIKKAMKKDAAKEL